MRFPGENPAIYNNFASWETFGKIIVYKRLRNPEGRIEEEIYISNNEYDLKLGAFYNEIEEVAENEFWDQEKATGEQVEQFYGHLERVMVAIDFHDPENPRQLMQRMRRLFNRIRIDVMEMNILRGILTNIEYSIKNRRE